MPLEIDWYNQIIKVTSPQTEVDMQTLADFIEDEMASPIGLGYSAIIQPEGKIEDENNPGVYSQIIVIFNTPWQLQFWGGSGYTRVYGGKLIGGLDGKPFKATGTAGDITVLESPVDGITVVVDSGGITDKDEIIGEIRQLRKGNEQLELVSCEVEVPLRKVAVDRLDYIIYTIKKDTDSDWSSPESTKTLYAWYKTLGDMNPQFMKGAT